MTNKSVQSLASILSLRQRMRLNSDCYLNSEVQLWSTFTCIVCTVWKTVSFKLCCPSFIPNLFSHVYGIGLHPIFILLFSTSKENAEIDYEWIFKGYVSYKCVLHYLQKVFYLCFYSKFCLIGFNVCSSNHLMPLLLLFSS